MRLAQEIAYLYGEDDFWKGDVPSSDTVASQLILYCGVMFGATGASAAVRVVAGRLAVTTLKQLPQRALTKGVIYPMVKVVATALSVQMTKGVFAKIVSKTIPIVGGVVSGGITLMTMRPMGMHLLDVLERANYSYTQSELEHDLVELKSVRESD